MSACGSLDPAVSSLSIFTRSQLNPLTPGIASSFNLSVRVVFPAPDAPVRTRIASGRNLFTCRKTPPKDDGDSMTSQTCRPRPVETFLVLPKECIKRADELLACWKSENKPASQTNRRTHQTPTPR